MTEARRLLEAGSEHERALLRAGAEEAPTEESVRAAARVLGFVPRAALLASLAALLAKAVKWTPLNGYVLAPALALGAVLTTAYAVSLHRSAEMAPHAVMRGSSSVSPLEPPLGQVAIGPVVGVPIEPSGATGVMRGDSATSLPVRGKEAASPAPHAGVRQGSSTNALQEQVGLVDTARALVASGDPGGALRAIDAYDHRFPHGLLAEEASLLRIQALAARGDRGAAALLAQRFHAEHPRSVHTDKIRWLLGDGSK